VYLVYLAEVLGPRVAAKIDKGRKSKKTYDEAVVFFEGVVYKTMQSIRHERLGRKKLANRLGLTDENIRNMERGRRKILVADLILLSMAMDKKPELVLEEIMRRFGEEISNWREKTGY
jgi:transcriptional regulator with XRE-family HTH domain